MVLKKIVQWCERNAKNDGGRRGEGEMDAGVNVKVPLALSSASCSPPANLQCNKNSFFSKTTRVPQRGFHLNFLPWVPPREVFTQGYYSFFLLFFSSVGHLGRGFQPHDGTQAPHGGFHLSPHFFIFSFLQ